MKTIGNFNFPETPEEEAQWEAMLSYTALHSKVLLVAKTRIEGAWSAYCVPVPGLCHEEETYLWEQRGVKLSELTARAAFPGFEGVPYAR